MPELLKVCPRGAWLSEEYAVQFLGLSSKSELKEAFSEGKLSHVFVEHGKRVGDIPHPFNKHRFFFVQKEGKTVSRPSINFAAWVGICKALEEGKADSLTPASQARIRDYTGYTDIEDAIPDLKSAHAIVASSELSGEDGDDGYRYGSNGGGRQRSSSRGPSSSSNRGAEGEIYTRADGKRVRRVKRSASGKDGAISGEGKDEDGGQRVRRLVRSNSSHAGSSSNLAGEKSDAPKVRKIRRSNSSHAGSSHRDRSLAGLVSKDENGDPQRVVRRIKRSNSSHSGMQQGNSGSLSGFLSSDQKSDPKSKLSGSRSVAAGEGEIYTRADGKKVRRVRKVAATDKKSSLSGFLNDGSKSSKKLGGSASVAGDQLTKRNLSGFLNEGSKSSKKIGSASVSGDKKSSTLSGFLKDGSKSSKKLGGSASVSGDQLTKRNLSGFLNKNKSKKKIGGSASVSGDKKSSTLSGFLNDGSKSSKKLGGSASVAGDKKNSLSGFLNDGSKPKKSGSASVAGDQLAVSKESSLTGEIYVRADGKKVRRVKRSSITSGSDQNVEIITRPDGTKVRRIRKTKPKPKPESERSGSSTQATDSSTEASSTASSDPSQKKLGRSLSGFFDKNSSGSKKSFSGSNSVAGDKYAENEIYVRADGKKVRRVRKVKPGIDDSKSLAGFLDADATTKPKLNGAATVIGDTRGTTDGSDKPEMEIYTRPDGKKVRRIRKTAAKPQLKDPQKKTLGGFLEKNEPSIKKKVGGSNSVAGDQIAISKERSLTGEVYVRADGKKVRRVKKTNDTSPSKAAASTSASTNENVEIITRPDGKRVRRIRKTKPNPSDNTNQLSGFLESQPKTQVSGGAATVSGAPLNQSAKNLKKEKSLGNFLGKMDSQPRKMGSASVAGDQVAVTKESSVTGEVYIREDGKKVRRVKKSSQAQPGDQVEIITRPDGTKVRRIRRAKKSEGAKSSGPPSLGDHLGSAGPAKKKSLGAQSLPGDMASGDVYVRADGKKVRRVRRTSMTEPSKNSTASSTNGDQYEVYVRPDGKKVRRIKRSVLNAKKKQENSEPSLAEMLSKNEVKAAKSGSDFATVAGDDITGKSSLQKQKETLLSKEAPANLSAPHKASQKAALTSEEQETAATYKKMMKMGMPEGAVIQKMSVDGVPQHIQDAVLAGDEPPKASPAQKATITSEEEETAATYKKMMKMGMPEGAVIQKMSVDGVPQHIQDAVLAGDEPPKASPAQKATLTSEEEETAATYKKMKKMGMPDGAVIQKMSVDGVPQHIQDAVLSGEDSSISVAPVTTTGGTVPEGMAYVHKDAGTIPDGMILVPKDQAAKTIPQGMVAIPKEQAGEGVPEGYVLVPKDQVKGDPGEDLILIKKDEINQARDKKDYENVDISNANIVSMDDLQGEVEKMKGDKAGSQPVKFLLQPLPEDKEMADDFIRKNLLPATGAAPPPKPEAPKKAETSSSVAEVLAMMSAQGGDFDAGKMQDLLEKLESAEKRQKKLEKQLAAAGVAIAEDIDYEVCVKKVTEIGKRMGEIGGSDVTHPDKEEQNRLREEYFKLEQEMEKYNSALLITDEYLAEQDRIEKKWEEDNAPGNLEALKKLRRHMPVEVRNMSEAQLTNEPTPNGKYLPKATAKKFKRTNVLQIIRRDPDDIVRMHPSTLENMRVTGMTLTERRAVYEHLRPCGPKWFAMKAEKMTERKWVWYKMMKDNFKENLAAYQRHVDKYGPPGNHPYATRDNPNEGCPLIGKQCPLKADKAIDYDGDYGYTIEATYEVSEIRKADVDDPGAKAKAEALELMKEKKANERSDTLKKHYKGKLLQVAKANGSCESMDEIVEKMEYGMASWIEDSMNMGDDKSKLTDDVKKKEIQKISNVLNECKPPILDICGRSGMQLSGKKTNDDKPDPRSIIECSLAEELSEAFDVFSKYTFNRMKELETTDQRVKATIDSLKKLLDDLRLRNVKTIKDLGLERLERSRKLKTQKDIENEIKEKMKDAEPPAAAAEAGGGPPGMPGPPRGGLMDAIKGGRGRGGGRGGLLDAINGRGRGGRGGRGGGGRGGLLDAINGRGRGGRGGGGRGGLLDAIQGRGRGGRGGGGGGGRGGLLDAIAARGRGRGDGGGGGGGGRGGLLAAIAARGGGG